ncbi:DNA-binding response regulator [Kyrpidia spormannii]|uniref:DNA-binding response regulator n=1 Tax=Kyrpidia spormannii TaxID=2055160 RepID=A0A2K8N8T5_9BACL|nr:DNA-binding response regulator [Kyrpidia spormannii]
MDIPATVDTTSTAEAGRHAVDFLKWESPDLLILDVVLPDVNGVELCRAIRRYSDVPVLFLSWKGTPDDIIAGLDKGGDDYVTKPFDPMVLVARVKARLRRAKVEREETPRPHTLCFGNVEIDFRSYTVRVDGRPVELFTKERQLLFFLARHPDQVFSPTQLHHHVWGWDAPSDERTVPVHISNLRKKIEPDPSRPIYIRTVRGFGYRFSPREDNGTGCENPATKLKQK